MSLRQTTIRLPEELLERLAQDAESGHRTVAQQIRMVLELHYAKQRQQP